MPLFGQHSLAEARDLDAATADDVRAFDALFGAVSVPWVNGDAPGFVDFSGRQEAAHRQWAAARAPLSGTWTTLGAAAVPGGAAIGNEEDAYQALVAVRTVFVGLRRELEAAATRYGVPIPDYSVAQPTAPDLGMAGLTAAGSAIDAGASAARAAGSAVASAAAEAAKAAGLSAVPWWKLGLLVGGGLLVTAALRGLTR